MRSLALVTILVLASTARAGAQTPPADEPPPPPPQPVPQPAPAPAPAPAPRRMPAPAPIPVEEPPPPASATGFTIELGFESIVEPNVSVSSTEQATILAVPLLAPTLFLGYRLRRVTLGVGLDLIRVDNSSSSTQSTTTTTTDASLTDIEIRPGVRVSLVESRDRKTELIGDFDIGYIAQSSGGTANSAGMSTPTNSEYIVQGGIGLRRWLAPSFAIGVTTGIRYDLINIPSSDMVPGESSSMSVSTTTLFASLQLIGVL